MESKKSPNMSELVKRQEVKFWAIMRAVEPGNRVSAKVTLFGLNVNKINR